MRQVALLDGSTIHAAGATIERFKTERSIRPINVLALASLLDSYVLFENLIVPQINWEYFCAHAPEDWVAYLRPVVEPVNIAFELSGIETFLSDPYIFDLFQGMIFTDKKLMIELDYRTYVGGDFGNFRPSSSTADEVDLIEKIMRERWPKDAGGNAYSYNAANIQHIDALHAVWRGCNYSQYCSERGYWYVPHELRGRLLDVNAALLGLRHSEPLVNKVVDIIKEIHRDQYDAVASGIGKTFLAKRPESHLLWQQFEMPLISGNIFQKSENVYQLFDRAYELRSSAASFRSACAAADYAEEKGRPDKAVQLYGQLVDLFKNVGKNYDVPRINWSVSLSIPWKLAVSGSLSKETGPKHLTFARDIYSSRLLPLTFQSDLARLFGQDPSEWLRKYGRGDATEVVSGQGRTGDERSI